VQHLEVLVPVMIMVVPVLILAKPVSDAPEAVGTARSIKVR
jgi:hypothetical protein